MSDQKVLAGDKMYPMMTSTGCIELTLSAHSTKGNGIQATSHKLPTKYQYSSDMFPAIVPYRHPPSYNNRKEQK